MTEPLTPEDKARYNAQHGLPPNACNCHHGSARYCPVHSQKDYDDAARSTDEGLWTTDSLGEPVNLMAHVIAAHGVTLEDSGCSLCAKAAALARTEPKP